jgi:hypothetical protein
MMLKVQILKTPDGREGSLGWLMAMGGHGFNVSVERGPRNRISRAGEAKSKKAAGSGSVSRTFPHFPAQFERSGERILGRCQVAMAYLAYLARKSFKMTNFECRMANSRFKSIGGIEGVRKTDI